jgi:signal peptidase II
MKHYRVVLWVLALAGLSADQASKYSVFAWLTRADNHAYWVYQATPRTGFALETRYIKDPDAAGAFIPHVNQGALFGLGRDYETQANWVFALVSLLAAAAIVYWSFRPGAAGDLWVCTALGLILGGTLGNLYDRVIFNGVRDFLHWNYMFDWPVFNIADTCLVCGACLLLLQAFGKQPATTIESNKRAATVRERCEVIEPHTAP